MSIELRKILVLGTSHVTEATAKLLDDTATKDWPVVGGPYSTYGWFMYAHEEGDDIPADLMAVFQFARAQGCDNVLFDLDADVIDDLPTYEW